MPSNQSLQVVIQRHGFDCSVACMAMLFGLSYEEVLVKFRHNVIAEGATIRQIQYTAKRLGHPLTWTRKVKELEEVMGVLCVRSDKWPADHLVVLWGGLIIDTDASVWAADVFLTVYDARPISIMTEEG